MKKGISLIVIVITIVIMVILSGVVVMELTDNNPITNAKKAVFQDAVAKYKEDFQMYKNANIGKDIEDCKGEDVKKYIESLNEKDIGKFSIENGNLIYTGGKKNERDWSKEDKIFTSRNKAPVLISEKKMNANNKLVYHLENQGINTEYTYVLEETIKDNETISKISKYNDKFKEEWNIDSAEESTINFQGKYLYLTRKNKICKVEDETGKIEKEVDLGIDIENFYHNRILIDDTLRVYVLDVKTNQLHVVTLNKETLEKIDTKILDLGLEGFDINIAEQSKKAIYLKSNIFEPNGNEVKSKLHIFKISSDKIEWEIDIDSEISSDAGAIEHNDDVIFSTLNLKELKKSRYHIDSRNGKIKKEVIISDEIGKIYSYDDQDNVIAIYSKNENSFIGKFDSNFKEIWNIDLRAKNMCPSFISMPEYDNIMVITTIEEEKATIRKYLFE